MAAVARSISRSMQLDAAPISCGVHEEIDQRRTKLTQPLPNSCYQYVACYLRRVITSNHPWLCAPGLHHCHNGGTAACLHRWRSSRRRRSRRRPAQAGRIWRAQQLISLVGPSAWCSAAPLLGRWQRAGRSVRCGMTACAHVCVAAPCMWGCWLELPHAATTLPLLAPLQNTLKRAQFRAKNTPQIATVTSVTPPPAEANLAEM